MPARSQSAWESFDTTTPDPEVVAHLTKDFAPFIRNDVPPESYRISAPQATRVRYVIRPWRAVALAVLGLLIGTAALCIIQAIRLACCSA